jgi:hypothetical protein
MAEKQIGDFTSVTTPATTDTFPCKQGGIVKKITTEQILSLATSNIDAISLEWLVDTNTWTYVAPITNFPTEVTFTINANANLYLYVKQKIKYTQNGRTKYGIIVAIGAYTTTTTITIYCGSVATNLMTSSPISNPKYATTQRPLDFPMGKDMWSYVLVDNNTHIAVNTIYSTLFNTWYGGTTPWGTGSVITPYFGIGLWEIEYYIETMGRMGAYPSVWGEARFTLSTSANSESDSTLSCFSGYYTHTYLITPALDVTYIFKKEMLLTGVVKYWLLGSLNGTGLEYGDLVLYNCTIKAKCLYV